MPNTTDELDIFVTDFLATYNDTEYQIHKKPFLIDEATYSTRDDIRLFSDAQDLKDMGYKIVSHRARVNNDAEYRRHNISTALKEFGSVRVVQP